MIKFLQHVMYFFDHETIQCYINSQVVGDFIIYQSKKSNLISYLILTVKQTRSNCQKFTVFIKRISI